MQTENTPPWEDGRTANYPKLAEDISADVVIVGGGITGIMTAYLLGQAGKSVVLLEQATLGMGATGCTTAFITQAIDTDPGDLISMLGFENARLVWQSGAAAISEIREIIEREGIACDHTTCEAYLFARTSTQAAELIPEAELTRKFGVSARYAHDDALGFNNSGYLAIPGQAKFHPLKFLDEVAVHAAAAGVRFFEDTTVVSLTETVPSVVVTADGHTIKGKDVIVATHLPFNKPSQVRFKKAEYRSYVLDMRIPAGVLKEGIYWDRANPFIYFRVDRNGEQDNLMIGGADHRADVPFSSLKNFHALERSAAGLLGGASFAITRRWHGPIVESVDGLPFIGAYGPHRYLATGFSGNGMTYGVVGAMMFRDLILGTESPWAHLYAPGRPMRLRSVLTKAPEYIAEFFGGLSINLFNR